MEFISETIKKMAEVPDARKKLYQIVESYGYPYERHFYETEDGYINMVVRISGKISTPLIFRKLPNDGALKLKYRSQGHEC